MIHTKEQVQEIMLSLYEQLGGHKFVVMTGSKFEGYSEDKDGNLCQQIKLSGNKARATHLMITYDEGNDLYNMRFVRRTFSRKTFEFSEKEIDSFEGVFCDQLQEIFTRVTGLYTRFCRMNLLIRH